MLVSLSRCEFQSSSTGLWANNSPGMSLGVSPKGWPSCFPYENWAQLHATAFPYIILILNITATVIITANMFQMFTFFSSDGAAHPTQHREVFTLWTADGNIKNKNLEAQREVTKNLASGHTLQKKRTELSIHGSWPWNGLFSFSGIVISDIFQWVNIHFLPGLFCLWS